MSDLMHERLNVETMLTDALLNSGTLRVMLDTISRSVNAFGAILLSVPGALPGEPSTASLERTTSDYFHGGWDRRDERMKLMPKIVRAGIAADQDLFAPDDMRREAYWQDFLEPNGLRWWAGVRVMAAQDLWCLSLQRTPDQGPFSPDELARLLQLSAPLSRGATLVRRLGDARLDGISDVLDMLGLPGFVIGRHGRIIRHNAEADPLLASALSLRRGELTVTGRPDLSRALRQHLEAAIRIDLDPGSRFLDGIAVPRKTGRPVFLQAHPLRRELASYFMPGCGLLLVTDPDHGCIPGRSMLRALFELTDREAQLARLLPDGRSLTAAAGQMGIGYETARGYLKSIFMKTGVRGQSDLTAMIARLGRAGGIGRP